MTPIVRPVAGKKPVVESIIKTEPEAVAHAKSLWGKEAFAKVFQGTHTAIYRVGIQSGTTKIVFGTGPSWDAAFAQATEGEKTYATIWKPKTEKENPTSAPTKPKKGPKLG